MLSIYKILIISFFFKIFFINTYFVASAEETFDVWLSYYKKFAQTKGIKAVPLKDIRRFNKLLKACERQGGKEEIKQLFYKDWQRDYNSARRMASWTSTHAMCVFVTFGYYFAGRVLATKPSS